MQAAARMMPLIFFSPRCFENTPAIYQKKVKVPSTVDKKFALKIAFINKIHNFGIDDYYVLTPY